MKFSKTVLIVLFLIITAESLGCSIEATSSKGLLTLETVVETFEKEGILLKENVSKSPDAYELNHTEPAIYWIGTTQDNLLIYIFDSFVDESVDDNKSFIERVPFVARNALIFYMPSTIPQNQDELKPLLETKKSISDIVFKHLNNGKEVIYKGESEHWEAKVTLKYYQNWWDDENDKRHYQSNSNAHHEIKYKKADVKNVGPVSYEYETTVGGSGSSTGLVLNNNGYADAGSRGGSGWLEEPDNKIYHITIKWNGKVEKFDLKAQ